MFDRARSLIPSFDIIEGVQEAYAVIRGAQKASRWEFVTSMGIGTLGLRVI